MKVFFKTLFFALLMGMIALFIACGGTRNGKLESVVSDKSDPALLEYVTRINGATPLKSKTEAVSDSAMLKQMGLWGMSLQGASLDEKTMTFNFQLADTLGEERRSSLIMMSPFIQAMLVAAGENFFGEENNPFKLDFLKAVSKTKIRWFFRFTGTDGLYADIVVVKAALPIPFEETPNDKVSLVDGFPAVKIGEQVWMAENLNIETPNSMCYDNDPEQCEKAGRLYTIEEARNVCPAGWHLPDTAELNTLLETVGDAKKLISANYDEWSKEYAGTDDYGFRLRSAGWYERERFDFGHVGKAASGMWMCLNCVHAYLWTSTAPKRKKDSWGHENVGYYAFFPSYEIRSYTASESDSKVAMSVRCVRGEPTVKKRTYETFQDERDGQSYKMIDLNGQTWMAENLRFKTDSSLCYDNDEKLCGELGRLYSNAEAHKACPAGWHLPDTSEFATLLKNAGDAKTLLHSDDWSEEDAGTDDYGFKMFPSGKAIEDDFYERYGANRSCSGYNYGCRGFLWTSNYSLKMLKGKKTSFGDTTGYYVSFPQFQTEPFVPKSEYEEKTKFSVRCVKGDVTAVELPEVKTYEPKTFLDKRDNRTYKSVEINGETWMAENLKFNTSSSWCADEASCGQFGRLYSGSDAMWVCPAGWHLPSMEEWNSLKKFAKEQEASLRTREGWPTQGTDDFNFSAVAAGLRAGERKEDRFYDQGRMAYFWTSTENKAVKLYISPFMVGPDADQMVEQKDNPKNVGYSVRCVMDKE